MDPESRYYILQSKKAPNTGASAVIRVHSGNQIEKLAGGAMILPENLEVCWEVGHPIFQDCKQRLIDRIEAMEYVSYFKRKDKGK